MNFGLDLLKKLKPALFRFKDNDDRKHFGLMAQDINKILNENEFAIVNKDPDGYYSVNYIEFIPIMILAMQELDQRISRLERMYNE